MPEPAARPPGQLAGADAGGRKRHGRILVDPVDQAVRVDVVDEAHRDLEGLSCELAREVVPSGCGDPELRRELRCPLRVDDTAAGVFEHSLVTGGELVPHVGLGPLIRGAETASDESDDLVPPSRPRKVVPGGISVQVQSGAKYPGNASQSPRWTACICACHAWSAVMLFSLCLRLGSGKVMAGRAGLSRRRLRELQHPGDDLGVRETPCGRPMAAQGEPA